MMMASTGRRGTHTAIVEIRGVAPAVDVYTDDYEGVELRGS